MINKADFSCCCGSPELAIREATMSFLEKLENFFSRWPNGDREESAADD